MAHVPSVTTHQMELVTFRQALEAVEQPRLQQGHGEYAVGVDEEAHAHAAHGQEVEEAIAHAPLRIAAIVGILFSVLGKVSAILKTIPSAVLGGIMLLLFGTIASVGINSLIKNKVDMGDTRNLVIASLILTLGIGGAEMNIGNITIGGIGLAALVGVVLNLIIPKSKKN